MCGIKGTDGVSNKQKTNEVSDNSSAIIKKRTTSEAFSFFDENGNKLKKTGSISEKISKKDFDSDRDFLMNSEVKGTPTAPPLPKLKISYEPILETGSLQSQIENKKLKSTGVNLGTQVNSTDYRDKIITDDISNIKNEQTIGKMKSSHEDLSTKTHDDGKEVRMPKKFENNAFEGITEKNNINDLLKDNFTDLVKKYDKAGLVSLKKNSKSDVLYEMKLVAKELMRNEGLNSLALLQVLGTKNDDQLKEIVAKSIGMIKEKHEGKGYKDLPSNKQKVVDTIVKGLKPGAEERKETIQNFYQNKIQTVLNDIITNDPHGDNKWNLSIESRENVFKSLTISMGLRPSHSDSGYSPEKEYLKKQTDFTKGILNSMMEKIEQKGKESARFSSSGGETILEGLKFPNTLTDKETGNVYNFSKKLGKGAMGLVVEYVNSNNPNDTMAIKKSLDNSPESQQESSDELNAHRHAMGDDWKGHPNLLELKGVVREDDGVLMVMEKAGGGDLEKVSDKISKAVENGAISEKYQVLLNRLLLRDVFQGLQHLQRDRNMMHIDLKDANCFIRENGSVAVGDLGKGVLGHEIIGEVQTTPDITSPEIAKGQKFNQKSDTWAAGALVNKMSGSELDFHKVEGVYYGFKHMAKIAKFSEDPNNRIIKKDGNEQLTHSDNIINAMMHPDETKRPTLEVVLNHHYFSDPLLNEPKLNELLQGIMSGKSKDELDTICNELNQIAIKTYGMVSS